METKSQENCGLTRRKSSQHVKLCPKDERNASLKKVSTILQKAEHDRTTDDQQVLSEYSEVVADLKQRWQRRDEAKRRLEEIEEPFDVIEGKCRVLAKAIADSEHLVVYTGAGISTAACIPDYRGTNGIWTRLQQGKDIGNHDLSLAEPTYTHMALAQLHRSKILKYVVSQNCDGLHLRSGLPRTALSELHGNMYIEVCKHCAPVREYWRPFDVTENTARYAHKTMRRCYNCSKELTDTIVHFGERGTLQWPLNWPGACANADNADTIICLGSSLKVLKKYPWLWQMNKPAKKRPNLYIVNLQWTPKDDCAALKIHGKCDVVMRLVMGMLGVETPQYQRDADPMFAHVTGLMPDENHTTNQPSLKFTAEHSDEHTDEHQIEGAFDLTTPPTTTTPTFSINNQLHSTLMAYYLANLQNNTMLNYLMYPYQTSLLYSGLHSIINPVPFFNYDFEINGGVPQTPIVATAKCSFCYKMYESFTCLFYNRVEAVFQQKLYRFSKKEQSNKLLVCVCCDYTTDDDSESDTNETTTTTTKQKKTRKIDDFVDANNECLIKKNKIQAGWFGKGCKKNRKNKKNR